MKSKKPILSRNAPEHFSESIRSQLLCNPKSNGATQKIKGKLPLAQQMQKASRKLKDRKDVEAPKSAMQKFGQYMKTTTCFFPQNPKENSSRLPSLSPTPGLYSSSGVANSVQFLTRDISYILDKNVPFHKFKPREKQLLLQSLTTDKKPEKMDNFPQSIEELKKNLENETYEKVTHLLFKQDFLKTMPIEFLQIANQKKSLKNPKDFLIFNSMKDDTELERAGVELGIPASRSDSIALTKWFETIMEKLNEEAVGHKEKFQLAELVYFISFREIVRQVSVQCIERGSLLQRIWKAYLSLIQQLFFRFKEKLSKKNLLHSQKELEIHKSYSEEIENTKALSETLKNRNYIVEKLLKSLTKEIDDMRYRMKIERETWEDEREALQTQINEYEKFQRKNQLLNREIERLETVIFRLEREKSKLSALECSKIENQNQVNLNLGVETSYMQIVVNIDLPKDKADAENSQEESLIETQKEFEIKDSEISLSKHEATINSSILISFNHLF